MQDACRMDPGDVEFSFLSDGRSRVQPSAIRAFDSQYPKMVWAVKLQRAFDV